jgi:hypothetical protein
MAHTFINEPSHSSVIPGAIFSDFDEFNDSGVFDSFETAELLESTGSDT